VKHKEKTSKIKAILQFVELVLFSALRTPGGGKLPEKLGGGARSASQNPYPIYDENLRFSLPYLWPDQKFNTLFMAVAPAQVF